MQVISKADAKNQGLKRFFTGDPCLHGHVTERFVSDGGCLACARDRAASYSQKNRELVNSKKRASYEKNADAERARANKRYRDNPEKAREKSRNWYAGNIHKARSALRARYSAEPEKHQNYARARYSENIEVSRARGRARYAANPTYAKAAERRHRAEKRMAVPLWFGELDALVWDEASRLVDLRRSATGFEWHADHMIPLRAKAASGLHTWNNCQVIPARLNMFKKNKLIFTDPCEWLKAGV